MLFPKYKAMTFDSYDALIDWETGMAGKEFSYHWDWQARRYLFLYERADFKESLCER